MSDSCIHNVARCIYIVFLSRKISTTNNWSTPLVPSVKPQSHRGATGSMTFLLNAQILSHSIITIDREPPCTPRIIYIYYHLHTCITTDRQVRVKLRQCGTSNFPGTQTLSICNISSTSLFKVFSSNLACNPARLDPTPSLT